MTRPRRPFAAGLEALGNGKLILLLSVATAALGVAAMLPIIPSLHDTMLETLAGDHFARNAATLAPTDFLDFFREKDAAIDGVRHTIGAMGWLGLLLQVFFAGLGLFSSAGFLAHALFAPALGALTLTLPLLARLGRVQRPLVMRSWGLLGLLIAQGLLIDLGRWVWMPISSLHPVNALALILVAYSLARRSAGDRL